jgi:hypothetical protein
MSLLAQHESGREIACGSHSFQYDVETSASSEYPGMPNSGTSNPCSSDSGSTCMLLTLFTILKN